MAGGRSFHGGGLKAKVGRKVGRAPVTISPCGGEDAGGGCVEHRAADPAEAVFHACGDGAGHLAAALLAESLDFRSFAYGALDGGHGSKLMDHAVM